MRTDFRKSATLAAVLLAASALTVSGTLPARADRCEDIAKELKSQVDGIKIGITTGKTIYLSHPQAREFSLGCRGANFSNELYVKADRRKIEDVFGATYLRQFVGAGEPAPQDFFFGGRYVDRLEKRDGVWRIAKRTVIMDWNRNEPTRSLWDEGMFSVLKTYGARDRSDPVYRR